MFGETSSAGFRVSESPCKDLLCIIINTETSHELPKQLRVVFPGSNSARTSSDQLTAITKPQFAIGPQKCVVRGPVGEFQNV